MALYNTLVRHFHDLHPPWRDSTELFWQCEDIVLCLAFTILIVSDSLSALAHPIL